MLNLELDQRIVIQENGKKRTISKREAVVKQMVNRAIAGDIRKIDLVTKLSEKHAAPEPFIPNEQDQFELQQALEALNVQEEKPDAKP